MQYWNVYLRGKLIDSVPYDRDCTAWYVRHTLVNHDGYPESIKVRRVK